MSSISEFIFDCYDDPTGDILRSAVSVDELPSFVKEAQYIKDEEQVSDDKFALVMVKEGHKFRKYATVDKGNTLLSVVYLLKQAHLLPEKAQKVAASNLIQACSYYGMNPPSDLEKLARGGSESELVNNAPPSPHRHEFITNPRLGSRDDKDFSTRTNEKGTQGTNIMSLPQEKKAYADSSVRDLFNYGDQALTKQKNWRSSPYVDVADWEPSAYEGLQKTASPGYTLLKDKYPANSYDQIKTAMSYFDEFGDRFHPRDRREYCVKLASRLQEIGERVPTSIEKYASESFGDDLEFHLEYRRNLVAEEFHPALDLLIEKRAHIENPETFAEALCEFDQISGLHYHWDRNVPDPWYSTFGPSLEKLAEDQWEWEDSGVRINKTLLENLATNGGELVQRKFGPDYLSEFRKNPVTFFKALPKPNQMVLARLAFDHTSGTGTE